jgi:hypothetical protein
MSIVYIKMAPVATHIPTVKGFRNIHAEVSGFAGTIINKLDSENGTIKSTYCIRLASKVMSPMVITVAYDFHCVFLPTQ